jgi:2-succinyl-6-hydroxy-2,4-cyclohexadiene-1-carboxylate synthase
MIITSDSVKINFEHFNSFNNQKDVIFFLHGFTGSLEDWRDIYPHLDERFNFIGIDLIGHGKSDPPADVNEYKTESLVSHINNILDHLKLKEVILLGYSIGGRVALNYAISYPQNIKCLILESTSAGIKNEKERSERIESDEDLASYIENNSIEKFAERWMNQDIFNTQRRFSDAKLKKIRRRIAQNSKTGLANTLRGFSTGKMAYLAESLNLIQSPVLLISGELDTKYSNGNSELKKKFSNAKHTVIKNAGHNTHLEESERFIQVINNYLNQF